MRTLGLLILGALLLQGCASSDKSSTQPDWVNGPSARYSDSQYLLGRGQAQQREQASDRARADLAKAIEVQVEEQSRDVTSASSKTVQGESHQELSQEVSRNVSTHTDKLIRGAEVKDIWQDPNSRAFNVLVVLDRLKTAHALREDMQALDDTTRAAIGRAQESQDLLLRIGAAQQAIKAQQERQALQRVLRVVDRGGQGLPLKWQLGQLEAERAGLLQSMTISVQSADGAELAALAAGALSEAGFKVNPDSGAEFVLQADLQRTPVQRHEGWYWLRASLEVELRDATGQVRGTARWPLKASAQNQALLDQRLMGLAASALKRELGPAIIGFAQ